jgi:hypothetical protein
LLVIGVQVSVGGIGIFIAEIFLEPVIFLDLYLDRPRVNFVRIATSDLLAFDIYR